MISRRSKAPSLYRYAGATLLTFGAAIHAAADEAPYLLDRFDTVALSNQDGACDWNGAWQEQDTRSLGADLGVVRVVDGALRLTAWGAYSQPSVRRAADLSGVDTAQLSFDFHTSAGVDAGDQVAVEVFFAGRGYTLLDLFDAGAGSHQGSRSYDITAFTSSDTHVRIRLATGFSGLDEFLYVDELRITAGETTCRTPATNVVADDTLRDARTDLSQLSNPGRQAR